MLRPYFEKDGITIYHGDAPSVLSKLPAASADLLLTDPPYCSGGLTESQRTSAALQGVRRHGPTRERLGWFGSDNMTTGGLIWLLRAVLAEGRRILRPRRSALVFTDWRMVPHLAPALESSGLRYRNMLVWDKGSAGMGHGFKPAHEIVLEFSNGSTAYETKNGSNVLRFTRVHASRRVHPTQKPDALLAELIRVTAPVDGLVIDPFMGSGSTLVAAYQRGMRAIGIEAEERFCEAAALRIEQLTPGCMAA